MQENFARQKKLITIVSILIPVAVALLYRIKIEGYDFTFLPSVYATINAVTAIGLVAAVVSVKNKNVKLHELLIKICMGLSLLFLALYILYHSTTPETKFGGEGAIRYVYYFLLITHILLSILVIPLVLYAYLYGINRVIDKHKKIVKYAFPLWLYVAVTGVLVYLLILPYYNFN